ncbi:hypothetical protein SO694_00086116 [Aureococcus anophagefferens]|uniref:Uncharacterized protein n=1 Tax=Aureococcus anophagefferens TaxID=44056 RepID=A0ABR1G478_AURAN
MEGRTFRQRWDDALDLMYDVRSIVLALRYHGVPFLVLALMVASYSWSVEAWTSVVNENRASLGVSIRGFRWVRGMAGDGLQVCKGATKSLTTLYELHTDLAYEYVGGTRVALDSCLGSAELRDVSASGASEAAAKARALLGAVEDAVEATLAYVAEATLDVCVEAEDDDDALDDLAFLEQQLDEPWDDAAAAPTPARRRLGDPCDVDVSVDAFEDLAKLSKRTISGAVAYVTALEKFCRRAKNRLEGGNGFLLFGAPPNALAFFCDWFEATAATTHSVVNATAVAFGNASSAYAGAFSRVGAVGDNGAGSPAMAWVDGLAPATLEAFLDDVLETADAVDDALAELPYLDASTLAAVQTRYVCGVALSAFSELRVETERRAIRTYARVRDGASDALAELYRMALRASGVTRYGRTQLARAKSYAALTKDVIDFSFDAVSTVSDRELGLRRYAAWVYASVFGCNACLLAIPDLLARTAGKGRKGSHFALPVYVLQRSFEVANFLLVLLMTFLLAAAAVFLEWPFRNVCSHTRSANVLLRQAVWALFDKAGDLATAMFSSKTVASLLDDVDLSVEMTCDLSDGYRGDARGVFWAALVAWMVQFYLWYYMSFRFYLSTHHALRKVLDDGETTLLDLIMDDEDDDERRKVDKAIDRLPKRVGDRVKRSKVLEKRCPIELAARRKRHATLRLALRAVDFLDDALDDAATGALKAVDDAARATADVAGAAAAAALDVADDAASGDLADQRAGAVASPRVHPADVT